MQRLAVVVTLVAVAGPIAPCQAPPPYRVSWWDAASVAAAGTLLVLPSALDLPKGAPSCGSPTPCDPAALPGIDRWAVTPVSETLSDASTVLLGGVGVLTGYVALHGLPRDQWRANFVVLASTAAWTAASAEWLKVLAHRKRPVLYTSAAPAAYNDRESQESWPSSHAALSFAAATSYLVISDREHLPHRTRNAILLYAGAVGVSVLRVAAGKHFPSDAVGGAALGAGIGWLVPTIHATIP
ncbi:MAG TPA: phosphatase PAP2 family protein [Gemmatimonadales bacterium]|nr:phosphatase PAP2 family protein [Gemmatimonadales bacterium]